MNGFAGNDQMDGGSGDDTMSGGSGDDFMLGRERDDNVNGDSGDDTILGGLEVLIYLKAVLEMIESFMTSFDFPWTLMVAKTV